MTAASSTVSMQLDSDDGSVNGFSASPPVVNARRAQKKAAKRLKRQKREELTSELTATMLKTLESGELSNAEGENDDGGDEDDDGAYPEDAAEEAEEIASQVGSEMKHGVAEDDDAASVGTSVAQNPQDFDLSPSDIAATTRTLQLLEKHHGLLEHPTLRHLRKALPPVVDRLSKKWHKQVSRTSLKLALKRSTREYELALDASARNATAIRANRLKKLETLNNVFDLDAAGEVARSRASMMRVPDGVASGEDVCMKMLTDGSTGLGGRGGNSRQLLLTSSGTPAVEAASNVPAAAASSSSSAPPPVSKLLHPIKCYICKSHYKELHFFYDSLCPSCAKLNYAKRELQVDMSGKIVLLTGARVKIGYRILVKLLRFGAFVIATTRFPHDLTCRLRLEKDFSSFQSRVHIYGLDFRNLTVLEKFVEMCYKRYTHLDAIINNACQTVRRPPAYYTHLLSAERIAFEDLGAEARQMLAAHHEFANEQGYGGGEAGQERLAPDQGMRRLESGSEVDVEVPPIERGASSSGGNSSHLTFKRPAGTTITIEEEDETMATVEEIVAPAAATSASAAKASAAVHADAPPKSNPPFKRAASAASSSSAASVAAAAAPSPASSSALPPHPPATQSRKRSRRGAMRAAEQQSQQLTYVPSNAVSTTGAQFTSASTLAAESTQLALLPSDRMTSEERRTLFPEGERDVNGQQLDLRTSNSWVMKLEDVPIGEAAEVTAINYLAPFLLNSKLKGLMIRGNESKQLARFIVNVSAMEGKFYRFKSSCLISGTRVSAWLDGALASIAVEDVKQGMLLLSSDRESVKVVSPPKIETRDDYIQLDYGVGSHQVTPNHLVTLRFSRNPIVFSKLSPSGYRFLHLIWWCAKELKNKSHTWRYKLPGVDTPAAAKVLYTSAEEAIAWATYDGDRMIAQGEWERGQIITSLWTPFPTCSYIKLTVTRGSTVIGAQAYQRKTFLYKVKTAATPEKSAVLPDSLAPHVQAFAWQWFAIEEAAGRITPLRRGQLFEVEAEKLLKLFEWSRGKKAPFLRLCAIPLVFTRKSDAAKVELQLPAQAACIEEGDAKKRKLGEDAAAATAASEEEEMDIDTAAAASSTVTGASSLDTTVTSATGDVLLQQFLDSHELEMDAPAAEGNRPGTMPPVDAFPRVVTVRPPQSERAKLSKEGNATLVAETQETSASDAALIVQIYSEPTGSSIAKVLKDPRLGGRVSQSKVIEALKNAGVLKARSTKSSDCVLTEEHIAKFDLAVIAATEIKGNVVCKNYSQVIERSDDASSSSAAAASVTKERFKYRPIQVGDDIDVVYMLHNPLVEESTFNAFGNKAFTFKQLEKAWQQCELDPSREQVLITELNPSVASTGTLDSRRAEYDAVCQATLTAVLETRPRVVLAFGLYVRQRWQSDAAKLTLVEDAELFEDRMELTLVDGSSVQVLFALHPSCYWGFDTVLDAVIKAHRESIPMSDEALTSMLAEAAKKCWTIIKEVKKIIIKDGQYVAIQVDGDQRFVLADGALTHNCHPHTNAAKAALNMMTRTSAQEYVHHMIFMTAVDTGWINDENPLPKAAQIAQNFNFQTPLDEIDAAARVLDPILTPLHQIANSKTKSIKDLKPPIPYGYFIKDYEKCEW